MQLSAKEGHGWTATMGSWEATRGAGPADTLTADFQPLELREKTCLCLCDFVTAALGD